MMKSNKQASRLAKASLLASLTIAALSATSSVQAKTINVETDNLFSQFFANIRCKRAAIKNSGEWTGRYWLKPNSLNGYCQIVVPDPVVTRAPPPKPKSTKHQGKLISVKADRLWNQSHANWRCPQLAKEKNGKWTGNWSDRTANAPSFCQVELKPPVVIKPTYKTIKVKAGRIWNQQHANQRCVELAKQNKGTWTKRWSSVGEVSSCEVKVVVKPTPQKPPKLAPIKPEVQRTHRDRRDRHSTREVSAGSIWDQSHANRKCPLIARQTNGTWEGEWRKTGANNEAVCKIKYQSLRHSKKDRTQAVRAVPTKNVREVDAGYIWDANQANTKCPLYAAQSKGRWTGKWRKVSTNNRAVCEVEFGTAQALPVVTAAPTTYVDLTRQAPARNTREIAAGPIWDANQAKTKCPYIASNNNGTWTGNWRKTGPNHASLCEVRF